MAAIGAGAAALAVPAGAVAAGTGGPAGLEALRGWYRREIEGLAEELRPRFAAGELRANAGSDYDSGDLWPRFEDTPKGRLEAAVAKRFGIEVTRQPADDGGEYFLGDEAAAYLVLALSPVAGLVDTSANHPGYIAADAAAWDVLKVARGRRMYVPLPDEPATPEVLS